MAHHTNAAAGGGGGLGFDGSVQGSIATWSASASAFVDSIRAWAIAATSTPGAALTNTTAATAGIPVQYSPALELSGAAWKSDATAESQVASWRVENRPVAGAAVITSDLTFLASIDGGAYATAAKITSAGDLHLYGAQVVTHEDDIWDLRHEARTDGSGNQVFRLNYVPGADSIANQVSMPLFQAGWENLSGTFTPKLKLHADGTMFGYGVWSTSNAIWAYSANLRLGFAPHAPGDGLNSFGMGFQTASVAYTATMWSQRTDGAGNAAIQLIADVQSASINAAMEIVNIGWCNDSGVTDKTFQFLGSGAFRAPELRASGDVGGAASQVSLTNVINAADDTQAVLGSYHVNGSAGVFHGWRKEYDGTTAVYVPLWTDA